MSEPTTLRRQPTPREARSSLGELLQDPRHARAIEELLQVAWQLSEAPTPYPQSSLQARRHLSTREQLAQLTPEGWHPRPGPTSPAGRAGSEEGQGGKTKMLRVAFISDTHGKHRLVEPPEADILVHCGDLSGSGEIQELTSALNWLGELADSGRYEAVITIAGNHDWAFERSPELTRGLVPEGVIYLEDSGVEVAGLRFWGSPVTPYFRNWAFNRRDDRIGRHWDMIPPGVDVLVTHGPPLGILDRTQRGGDRAGCPQLLRAIRRLQPQVVAFGHLHSSHGIERRSGTTFVNAAVLDDDYEFRHQASVVEVQVPQGRGAWNVPRVRQAPRIRSVRSN